MKTAQLEMRLFQEEVSPKTIKINEKKRYPNVIRSDGQIVADLAFHYTKRRINFLEKKGVEVTQDLKSEIYESKYDYFKRQVLKKLRRAYVAALDKFPLLPNEVY